MCCEGAQSWDLLSLYGPTTSIVQGFNLETTKDLGKGSPIPSFDWTLSTRQFFAHNWLSASVKSINKHKNLLGGNKAIVDALVTKMVSIFN